jgi:hypothetical protein
MALTGFRCAGQPSASSQFTPLEELPAPSIAASAEAAPGGRQNARNLVDGRVRTEYASNAQGTNTFVEFNLGTPTRIGAFRHVDRDDPATVAASNAVNFIVQASTNLASPDWASLPGSLVLTNGKFLWIDGGATNYSRRFYRVLEQ